jgi:hypothetical protein
LTVTDRVSCIVTLAVVLEEPKGKTCSGIAAEPPVCPSDWPDVCPGTWTVAGPVAGPVACPGA